MPLWYIDALDVRGGMALATYRDPDLNKDTVDLGKPAVFIGPPFFQGESVASRAIGFAATRGSFQLGLFSDDSEIAFASLQGVCEFVRRVYVSSGGGDTDSGISPAPVVPNPESGGGEPMPFREGGVAIVQEMLNFVSTMHKGIASISYVKLSQSEGRHLNRREGEYKVSLVEAVGHLTGVDALLAYGSSVLIEELLLRFPNRTEDRGTWMKSMMRLGRMLSRLGLLESLFRGPEVDRLARVASSTGRRYRLFDEHPLEDYEWLPLILGLGPYLPWYRSFGPPIWAGWCTAAGEGEPMDDLSSFPIPSVAAKHARLKPETASARDLLSVFLADPTVLEGEKASLPESSMIAAFVLLSSMLIVSAGQVSLAPMAGTRIGSALLEELVREAIIWMDSQMPGYLFHGDIEKHIRSASQLRYGTRPREKMAAALST